VDLVATLGAGGIKRQIIDGSHGEAPLGSKCPR
jgi:hypothetical protein